MGVRDDAEAIAGELAGLRHAIHREPEIGLNLPRTQQKVLAALDGLPLEIATGTALLTPVVPNKLAGAALTAFSGSLLAMYLRTPAMHKPGSVWPAPPGMAVSKDVWMLGIGLGLLASPAAPGKDT